MVSSTTQPPPNYSELNQELKQERLPLNTDDLLALPLLDQLRRHAVRLLCVGAEWTHLRTVDTSSKPAPLYQQKSEAWCYN